MQTGFWPTAMFVLVTLLASSFPCIADEPTGEMKMDISAGRDLDPDRENDSASVPENAPYPASFLLGRHIVNASGERLGKIEDMLIGPDGRIIYLVIAHGGMLGIGDRLTAVPFAALGQKKGELVLAVSRKDLEAAPRYASGDLFNFLEFERRVNAYYGAEPSPPTGGHQQEEGR